MRTVRTLFLVASSMALVACASSAARGWAGGKDAVPFNSANADCKEVAAGQAPGAARDQTFEKCMLGKGWTRP
jgi:hypothetical protein